MAASPNVPPLPSEAPQAAAPRGFDVRLPSAQLGDLIQINCVNRVRGAFRVSSGPHEGHLFFDQGQLIHADFGDVTGLDAVVSMLGWQGGTIEPCRAAWPRESSIDMGADALLLRAAQRIDESSSAFPVPQEATTRVVRRVAWPAEPKPEPGEALPSAGEAGHRSELTGAPGLAQLAQLAVVQVDVDGTIQKLKAGASTELADTAFFCQRMATTIGETLGLGECRALSFEAPREGIVVFKARSIVGARGQAEDLEFILRRVGLK